MENKLNRNVSGLNLDSVDWQIDANQVTYALNANLQSLDGDTYTYTNDPSNQSCIDFEKIKPGYKILRILPIQEQNRTIVFLQGPDGKSEIGEVTNNEDDCLTLDEVETDCGCAGGKHIKTTIKADYKDKIDEYTCPEGYTLVNNPDGSYICEKYDYQSVTINTLTSPTEASQNTAFGFSFPSLYSEGWNIGGWGGNGTHNNGFVKLSQTWWYSISAGGGTLGRVNQIAKRSVLGSNNDWVGFIDTFCLDQAKTYYLAIAADNYFRVHVDGILVLDPKNVDFEKWQVNQYGSTGAVNAEKISYHYLHIYPIRLDRGPHSIQLEYFDVGDPEMIAAEIYDNTPAEIQASLSPDDLNIIWSTKDQLQIQSSLNYSCPDGYKLAAKYDGSCALACVRVNTEPPTIEERGNNCCTYRPILIDDCCEDCCKDCYGYVYTQDTSEPSHQFDLSWIDCQGRPQFQTFTSGGVFGTIGGAREGTTQVSRVIGPTPTFTKTKLNDCDGCIGQSIKNCCLNFDINYALFATYKIDQCETRIYFVSKNNPPRFLSLENPLNRDACGKRNDCGGRGYVTKKTCKELNIIPDTCHPNVDIVESTSGGNLRSGMYQFAIAYTDEYGEEITDYFDFTHGISVVTPGIHDSLGYETGTAIKVNIRHKSNIFDFFNLVVCESVENTTTYSLVGNYRKTSENVVIYTGEVKKKITDNLPLIRTPYYDKVGIIEKQNDMLMLADLEKEPDYNFQPFANKMKLMWETVEMPAGGKWDYSNPEIAYFFRGYQRDEVYAFGIKFKLKTGKYTEAFHIPGRAPNSLERAPLTEENFDVFRPEGDCISAPQQPKWKVYNTAGTGKAIVSQNQTPIEKQYACEIKNSLRGEFGVYESAEKYPCNDEIWDADAEGKILADTPIRFHKFPDSLITHIHNTTSFANGGIEANFDRQVNIYPIGVRIDKDIFNNLLNNFEIFHPTLGYKVKAKELICGFELVYGSRVGHKSVVAKGLVYDVGTLEYTNKDKVYYANYPFNDIGRRFNAAGFTYVDDPYLMKDPAWYKQDRNVRYKANSDVPDRNNNITKYSFKGFAVNSQYKHERFTFHSPDTHFQAPRLGSELKLETLEMGQVKGHFVEAELHSKLRFLTNLNSVIASIVAGSLIYDGESGFLVGPTGGATNKSKINIPEYLPIKKLILELIEQNIPRYNLAWQYNAVAKYNEFLAIPNSGHKRRSLDYAAYLPSANVSFANSDHSFSNRFRESAVYLKVSPGKLFNEHYPNKIDNSRYVFGETGKDDPTQIDTSRTTRAYYCSIKQPREAQYGQISDIRYVSTNYHVNIIPTTNSEVMVMEDRYYPAFGGDTFITPFALKRKMIFFTQNLVGKPDDFVFNYHFVPNIGYPTYYTGYDTRLIDLGSLVTFLGIFGGLMAVAGAAAILGGSATLSLAFFGQVAILAALDSLMGDFNGQVVLDKEEGKLGFVKKGMMYLASIGIPVFYVESDVNTHFRHGTNPNEGNYYPNVEGLIPDKWLQHINTPYELDNTYNYDSTFSRQNVINYNPSYNPRYPQLYCETDLFNRVIYSDPLNKNRGGSQNADSQIMRAQTDPWLNYRRGNYYDFPKTGGKLIALNAVDNGKVYARFENTTKVYNAIITLENTSPLMMEIGNASMFNQKPIDLATSDIGYVGTQHKAFVKTPQGAYWTDAKRGDIYFVGQGFDEISNRNSAAWFNQNLPFKILKDFPDADVDNPAKGIGIVMTWDDRLKKLLVTKLDYRVLPAYRGQITYSNNSYFYQGREISLTDDTYFENHSWTMGYSPIANEGKGGWVSFYSFLPNHYVPFVNHFQSATQTGIWNHNLSLLSYQTYYGKFYPYILEYSVNTGANISTLNSVTSIHDILKYYNEHDYYSLGSNNRENLVNFTKAILYNKEQVTGEINLVPQMLNNAQQKLQYPTVSGGRYFALISKREHRNTFNGFFDLSANKQTQQPIFSTKWEDIKDRFPIDKVINPDAVSISMYRTKVKMRSTYCRVRLIQDKYNRFKFVNHFNITQTNNSII